MHEFVLSVPPAKRDLDIKTLDVAKRLLDYGFHPRRSTSRCSSTRR